MDVNSIIDNLASKFGTTVPYLIEEMTKYYIIENIIWLILSLLIGAGLGIISKKLITYGLKMKKECEWDDWEPSVIIGSILGVVSIIFVMVFFNVVEDLLQWCITPTASAMTEVMKMISR